MVEKTCLTNMRSLEPGISVVICCYNSSQRLPKTLEYLSFQEVEEGLPWEVIVIDNSSTDGTSEVALKSWPQHTETPIRIVTERRLGLTYARQRGLREAKYEIISFIDDDNWVCPRWIALVWEIMSAHPEVGACGGVGDPAPEIKPPWWFERFQRLYVGPHWQESGDVTSTLGVLSGSGLTLRKSAWQHLDTKGFKPLLVDRQGTKLSSGGDHELCFALRLDGWRLWYDQRLKLHHFIPSYRLEWSYLRQLCRGFGAASVGLDPYLHALNIGHKGIKNRLRRIWHWHLAGVMKSIIWYESYLRLSKRYLREGRQEDLTQEGAIGRLFELLHVGRKRYAGNFQIVQQTFCRSKASQ